MKRNRNCVKILRYRKDHPFIFYSVILYLGAILIYVIVFHIFFADYSKPMPLNEVGDFLAGVFAPIAFLFLYIGYKQNSESLQMQGRELRISNDSFKKQCEELANSVEQQRQLVEAATEDLKLSKTQYLDNSFKELVKSQPFIHLIASATKWVNDDPGTTVNAVEDSQFNKLELIISFANSRSLAREIVITFKNKGSLLTEMNNSIFKPDNEMKSQKIVFDYPFIYQMEQSYIVDTEFTYLDELDQHQYQKFQIKIYRDLYQRKQRVEIFRGDTSFINTQPH